MSVKQLQMAQEAADQEDDALRDTAVACFGGEYIACHRYEVNPSNGWLTIGLMEDDGLSTICVQPGKWCLGCEAEDFFDLERSQITYNRGS